MAGQVKLWPTPKAADSNPCGMQAMLRYNERTNRKTLITEVAKTMWPTPRASEGGPDYAKKDRSKTGISLPTAVGGSLSPMWVEWLMGYQTGWTELRDWVMPWFLSKPESPS